MQSSTVMTFGLLSDHKRLIEQMVARCAQEHGGQVIGEPSVTFIDGVTLLSYDEGCRWWDENVRVHLVPVARRLL